jgi:aspartyl-tRNA(Asn)/glutamyl-tRNA(Gln) amidotransferase subunit C
MLASAMPAEREDFPVARVAALARLELSPAEAARYQAQLARILELVGQVAAAGFEKAGGAASDDAAAAGERADAVLPSLEADVALANAPDARRPAGLVRVPKVIG